MKIGYINDVPFFAAFGGKEIQMQQYIENLKDEKEIEIIKINPWDKEIEVDTIHFFGHGGYFFDVIMKMKGKKDKREIIISPTYYSEFSLRFLVSYFFGRIIPVLNHYKQKKMIFEMSDLIVVNSNEEKKQISYLFGKTLENKIRVIYNGVEKNTSIFDEQSNEKLFIKKYSLKENYILSVGFMDERKNTENMIEAFLNIFPKVNKQLVIIGGYRFNNPNKKEKVYKLIKANEDKILHIDYLPRNSEILKSAFLNCAFHVLPSHIETPGISNLEALAFGKPIVVGECKPVREYFDKVGIFCNPKKILDIEKAFLKANETHKNKFYFKKYIDDNYLVENLVIKLKEIYLESR